MIDRSELYGLPLEHFTHERNALAKSLRGTGRRDEAAEVAKLPKPSLAAWAVNQLVRTQSGQVDALFKAGDALQKAHSDLLAGSGRPGAIREAAEAERVAVQELTKTARGLLSDTGHGLSEGRLEQVSETLHAAALDPGARAQVRDGCLVRELRHVGLGTPSAAARPTKAPKPKPTTKLQAVRKAEAEARRRAERASRELEAAEERRDRIAGQLAKAEQALASARVAAKQAAREHEQKRRALERL